MLQPPACRRFACGAFHIRETAHTAVAIAATILYLLPYEERGSGGRPDDRASRQRYLRSTMLRDSARHQLRPRAVRLKLSEMFFGPTTKSL